MAYADQFDVGVMKRCSQFLARIFRKAQLKSGGNKQAARGRMLAYSQRSAGVQMELVRQGIGVSPLTVAAGAAPIAHPEPDPHPFTAEQISKMQVRVQEAANAAISEGKGDPAAARMVMWRAAKADDELARAIAGLLIMAALR